MSSRYSGTRAKAKKSESNMSRGALAANIVKCITSSLSLISSSTIIHMIRKSPRGLKSPYSQIIFGLSIGDILLTLGLLIGPFAVSRGTLESPLAIGNTLTYDYAGFILVLSVFTTTFYLLFLIYFFLRRVKYRISPQKFAYGEERPKVQVKVLSQMYPEATWKLCFFVVIHSGADVPPAQELKIPQNIPPQMSEMTPQQHQQQSSQCSYSSEESESTNGDYYEGLRRSMIAASLYEGWYAQ